MKLHTKIITGPASLSMFFNRNVCALCLIKTKGVFHFTNIVLLRILAFNTTKLSIITVDIMTLNIMMHSIMKLGIKPLSIITFNITKLGISTLSKTTLCIKTFSIIMQT